MARSGGTTWQRVALRGAFSRCGATRYPHQLAGGGRPGRAVRRPPLPRHVLPLPPCAPQPTLPSRRRRQRRRGGPRARAQPAELAGMHRREREAAPRRDRLGRPAGSSSCC
eukprot:365268-Chlamydomonas_euryale.AAC.10